MVPVPCIEKSKPPPCSDCQALQYKCTEWREGEQCYKSNKTKENIKPFKVHLRLEDIHIETLKACNVELSNKTQVENHIASV